MYRPWYQSQLGSQLACWSSWSFPKPMLAEISRREAPTLAWEHRFGRLRPRAPWFAVYHAFYWPAQLLSAHPISFWAWGDTLRAWSRQIVEQKERLLIHGDLITLGASVYNRRESNVRDSARSDTWSNEDDEWHRRNIHQHKWTRAAALVSETIRATSSNVTTFTFGPSGAVLYPTTGASQTLVHHWPYTIELPDFGHFGFVLAPERIIPTVKDSGKAKRFCWICWMRNFLMGGIFWRS